MKWACMLVLIAAPAAALPGAVGTTLDNSGSPTGLAVSDDHRFVAIAQRSGGGLKVWDRASYAAGPSSPTVCSDAQSVVYAPNGSTERFFVGCGGGQVHTVDISGSSVPPTFTVSDPITLTLEGGDVVSLVYAPGDTVVHAVEQASGTFNLHSISLDGSIVNGGGLPQAVAATANSASISDAGTTWVIGRSDGFLSSVARTGTSYSVSQLPALLALASVSDVAVDSAAGLIAVADASDDAVWSFPIGGVLATELASVSDPQALSWGSSDGGRVLWVAAAGGGLLAFDTAGDELLSLDLSSSDGEFLQAVGGEDGAVYVAEAGGSVQVVANWPFLSELSVDPSSVGEGDSFELTFTSSSAGEYDVRVGGTLEAGSGASLATGTVEADTPTTVTLSADDLTVEGDNRLFVFVDRGAGVESVVVVLDTPPEDVGAVEAGAADSRLDVAWTSTDEADVTTFELYVSQSGFDESSLPTFDAVLSTGEVVSYPLDVDSLGASIRHEVGVRGLDNGTEYWVAVRAIDAGGLVGPLSVVVSGTPASTCSAAECAGEVGCSLAPGKLAWGLLLVPLFIRRR